MFQAQAFLFFLLWAYAPSTASSTIVQADGGSHSSDHINTKEVDYLIVGGGGSGIQMALYLEKYGYSYVLLEKEAVPGSHWLQFPRFKELISVNKWSREPKHALRYDWHSFLETPLMMRDVTEAYFPSGPEFQEYMSRVVELAEINIEYNSKVDHIMSSSQTDSKPCVRMSDGTKRCARRRIFVGTGLEEKKEPLLEAVGAIPYSQITREMAKYKRVCIFGNGNAGFEVAQNIFDVADKVGVYGKHALKIAAITKSVGDVRTKFLQVLENFHFKLRDMVDQSDGPLELYGMEGMLDADDVRVAEVFLDVADTIKKFHCEVSVIATGFSSNVPGLNLTTRFPATSSWYESKESSKVSYIGWLMHEMDFRRSSSGFQAGFRYLIRNLVHHIREEDHGIEYPRLTLTKEEVLQHVAHRLDVTSDLIILQDGIVLRDAIVPAVGKPGMYHYYEGVIYQYHEDIFRNEQTVYFYFSWGDTRRGNDVFENLNRYSDSKVLRNSHIHPVIEINGMVREMIEDPDVDWSNMGYHGGEVQSIVRAALDNNTADFTPRITDTLFYQRAVVNMPANVTSLGFRNTKSREMFEKGQEYDFTTEMLVATIKSIRSKFSRDDLQKLTAAASAWMSKPIA